MSFAIHTDEDRPDQETDDSFYSDKLNNLKPKSFTYQLKNKRPLPSSTRMNVLK